MIDIFMSAALALAAPHIDRTIDVRQAAVVREAAELPSAWEPFARCVEKRESRGIPDAINPTSGAAGLYQFMPAWRDGLPYMVADRLRDYGMTGKVAKGIRVWLSDRDIADWPEVYQRIGFAAVINAGGWSHWRGGNGCNGLVPR